jgi:hypothetical protein
MDTAARCPDITPVMLVSDRGNASRRRRVRVALEMNLAYGGASCCTSTFGLSKHELVFVFSDGVMRRFLIILGFFIIVRAAKGGVLVITIGARPIVHLRTRLEAKVVTVPGT